jgi:hypothetical protein
MNCRARAVKRFASQAYPLFSDNGIPDSRGSSHQRLSSAPTTASPTIRSDADTDRTAPDADVNNNSEAQLSRANSVVGYADATHSLIPQPPGRQHVRNA